MTAPVLRAAALTLLVGFAGACDRSITVVETTHRASDAACFSCHGDSVLMAGIQLQWNNSRHASGANIDRNDAPCSACHTGDGFAVAASGGAPPAQIDNPTSIHCFSCHAPHARGDFSTRVAGPTTLRNGHVIDLGGASVCAACHRSRHGVDTCVAAPGGGVEFSDAHWGPHHAPQADIFAGSNGYEYPLVPYFDGPHLERMPEGCLHCHFDVVAGDILGGHTFRMRDGAAPDDTLHVAACNQDGCHSNLEDFDYHGVQSRVSELLSLLEDRLRSATLVDGDGHPVAGRRVTSADTAGAVWNYLMVREDRSLGVHNPDYVLDLLGSSLLFMGGTLPR